MYGLSSSGLRSGRRRSARSRSPHYQEDDPTWRNDKCSKDSKARWSENDRAAIERIRGRPRGHNRTPLTREEQRARNALYERERREKLAEGWTELREAMNSNVPQNKLLSDAAPFIKDMKKQMKQYEKEMNLHRSRNNILQAKLAGLKAAVKPNVMKIRHKGSTQNTVESEELSNPTSTIEYVEIVSSSEEDENDDHGCGQTTAVVQVVEQEDVDSGVHSSGASAHTPDSSSLSSDPRVTPPQPSVHFPEPTLLCSYPSLPTSDSRLPSSDLLLPENDIPLFDDSVYDCIDSEMGQNSEETQLQFLESHYYDTPGRINTGVETSYEYNTFTTNNRIPTHDSTMQAFWWPFRVQAPTAPSNTQQLFNFDDGIAELLSKDDEWLLAEIQKFEIT